MSLREDRDRGGGTRRGICVLGRCGADFDGASRSLAPLGANRVSRIGRYRQCDIHHLTRNHVLFHFTFRVARPSLVDESHHKT